MQKVGRVTSPEATGLAPVKVGRVTAWNEGCLEVFWNPETREILVHEMGWFSRFPKPPVMEELSLWHAPQSDCNIIQSVAMYLGCLPNDLYADQIMVFDQKEHHGKEDEHLDTDIYNCDWSDFACDGLILHFNVQS